MQKIRLTVILLCGIAFPTVASADWAALAVDDEANWSIVVRSPTKKQAEAEALKECRKLKGAKNCKVVGSSDRLGHVALAASRSSVRVAVRDSLEEARRAALADCAEQTPKGYSCEIGWTGINGGRREPPRSSATADCRPRTAEIRCRSNCVNGDCVVEYENGCKVRVQVSPRFDSFSNQWTYPSPPC